MPEKDFSLVKVTYAVYFIGFFTFIGSIVGLVMAYVLRSSPPQWEEIDQDPSAKPILTPADSHYTYLIRSWWIGLLYSVIGLITLHIIIGWIIIVVAVLWAIIRIVIGFKLAMYEQEVPNPYTWGFTPY